MHCVLVLGFAVALAQANVPVAGAAAGAPADAGKAIPSVANPAPVDAPPPSTYDLTEKDHHVAPSEETSVAWQLGRMLFSLAVVIGLIFLLVRIALPRLMRWRTPLAGSSLRVLDRVQLDQRHAVLLIEVYGSQHYLVGTGERGVALIARVDAHEGTIGEAHVQG